MRTRKMRLVSALLALAMLLAMVPVGAWAEGDSTSSSKASSVNNIQFRDADGTYGFGENKGNTYKSGSTSYELMSFTPPQFWITMSSKSSSIRFTDADVEIRVLVRNGILSAGTFREGVITYSGGMGYYGKISDGNYYSWVFNDGTISGGNFYLSSQHCVPTSFNSFTVEGISFVNRSTVSGGTFSFTDSSARFYNDNGGTLSGQTKFESDSGVTLSSSALTNKGKITSGSYLVPVQNDQTTSGGTFSDTVTNNGTISNGTFSGAVINNSTGTISNGTFRDSVTNSGIISGGTFTQNVTDSGTISGGIFKNKPAASNNPASYLLKTKNGEAIKIASEIDNEAYIVGKKSFYVTTDSTNGANMSNWVADNDAATISRQSAHSLYVSINTAATTDGTITLGPPDLKAPTANDFTVSVSGKNLPASDNSEVKLPYSESGYTADVKTTDTISADEMGTVTPKYYPVKDDGTLDSALAAGTVPTKPGKYQVKLDVAGGMKYSQANDLTSDDWTFTIKKIPAVGDFEFDSAANEVKTKTGISGMGTITTVTVKDKNGTETEITNGDTSNLKPGDYIITKVTVTEGDNYSADTVDIPSETNWSFTIKDTTSGDDNNNNNPPATPDDDKGDTTPAKTYPISGGDNAEVTVTSPDGTTRDNNEAEKGDTVRVNLPEDKRNPGGMVFDGWILDVEPEEKTADVLDALKQNGFKPGEPDTSFTVPDLPDGTKLNFRPHYVTPDQSDSGDDSFLMTAAAVAGGAALTGFVAWQGYNIFAEVYMKQALPAGAVLPQNRQELALLLWNKAGTPAPADSTLYTDVDPDDANAQAAARWAVENELLKPADKSDSNVFKPKKSVSVGQVYRAWNKAETLNAQ